MDKMRERFNSTTLSIMDNKKANSGFMTKQKYDELLMKVKISKSKKGGKKPEDYQRLKRYDIIKVENVEKLIVPIRQGTCNIRRYVFFEELFNIIHETHLALGHAGRNRMLKEVQKKYKNVTAEAVMIYLGLCEYCQKKPKAARKAPVVKPIVFQELESRCQVDVIDMQSEPDGDYRFIFVFEDDLTKFVQLRALKTDHEEEVASHLIDIFTIFGAPSVIQSTNGREFCDRVVKTACEMWSDLKIVHGNLSHSQSSNSSENPGQEIVIMLSSWCESNKCSKWSEGLRFVQIMKNRSFHDGIKCTPYEAMFGMPYKLGLNTSFANDSIKDIRTEEDLQALIESYNNASDHTNSEGEDDSNAKETDPLLTEYPPTIEIKEENEEVLSDGSFDYELNEFNQTDVEIKKQSDEESLESQPSKIRKISKQAEVGDTVTLRVPDGDKGRCDSQELIAVILAIENEEIFRLGTVHGKLMEWYTRDQFTVCENKFILPKDVPDQEITLRDCLKKSTYSKGQGGKRCVCKGGCKSVKCRCKKFGELCTYKCHNNSTCLNRE